MNYFSKNKKNLLILFKLIQVYFILNFYIKIYINELPRSIRWLRARKLKCTLLEENPSLLRNLSRNIE